jgi:hypothetical protein
VYQECGRRTHAINYQRVLSAVDESPTKELQLCSHPRWKLDWTHKNKTALVNLADLVEDATREVVGEGETVVRWEEMPSQNKRRLSASGVGRPPLTKRTSFPRQITWNYLCFMGDTRLAIKVRQVLRYYYRRQKISLKVTVEHMRSFKGVNVEGHVKLEPEYFSVSRFLSCQY